jgi:hypothetical protein
MNGYSDRLLVTSDLISRWLEYGYNAMRGRTCRAQAKFSGLS